MLGIKWDKPLVIEITPTSNLKTWVLRNEDGSIQLLLNERTGYAFGVHKITGWHLEDL
jgi:hypothetical protein